MSSSPLVSGTKVLEILSFISFAVAQSIPGAAFLKGNGAPGAGAYQLVDNYTPDVFFTKFNFYSVRLFETTSTAEADLQ